MSRVVVLMYHGIPADAAELADIDAADRPYAVPLAEFEHQLGLLARHGLQVIDPAALARGELPAAGGVVITFDDGHASNHHHALPALARRGLRGLFFVTSDFIGQRRGFCSWRELREMADAGMTIGSHGRTHRFFDDLDDEQALAEFRDSKAAIELATGKAADQISFPGGRYAARQLRLGAQAGYRLFHTSEIGSLPAAPLGGGALLPRIAMKPGFSDERFLALASAAPSLMRKARLVAGAKTVVRRTLGNRLYHALYERLSA